MHEDINKIISDLNNAQVELEQELDNKIKTEEEIIDTIKSIVSSLMNNDNVRVHFNNKDFRLKVQVQAVDEFRAKTFQKRYIPAVYSAEYDPNQSYRNNITVTVECWLRNLTGTLKPEMIQ